MKRAVILLIFILLFSSVSAKEVSITEMFKVSKDVLEVSGKEVYYYAGFKLIASDRGDLEYKYQDRTGSDFESKSLPFGQEIFNKERFSFTGKELDSDLYYFSARYYDSELGRFTSADPILSEPSYQYVGNNPLRYVDPDGKRIRIMGDEGQRGKTLFDFSLLLGGEQYFSLQQEGSDFYLKLNDNYDGEFPNTFNLVKSVADHADVVDVYSGRGVESIKTVSHTYSKGRVGESSASKAADYEMVRAQEGAGLVQAAGKANKIANTNIPIRGDCIIAPCIIARWADHDVVELTASGNTEIHYRYDSQLSILFEDGSTKSVFTPKYYALMHELGHVYALFNEDYDNFHDQVGKLNPDDPYSLGAGAYAEGVRLKESGRYPGVVGRAKY
jgi:RHS repeat-associated protein